MATNKSRAVLTTSQQGHLRAHMAKTAAAIASQIHEYVTEGEVKVCGKSVGMTPERLASYRIILERTVPTLSSTEVTHRSGLADVGTDQLVNRLVELAKARPELASRLSEAFGGRLINNEVQATLEAPKSPVQAATADCDS